MKIHSKSKEEIGKLALALSKFQGEIVDVFKAKKGYGYNYAELTSILKISRPLLVKYELSVTQSCGNPLKGNGDVDYDAVNVHTKLMHSSGQSVVSTLAMRVTPMKGLLIAQVAGLVLTYCRRYSYSSILGISQTDELDDEKIEPDEPLEPTTTQVEAVQNLIHAKGMQSKIPGWLEHFNVETLDGLTEEQAIALTRSINKYKKADDLAAKL